ncbi:MAG: HAD-IA family hydrolase [Pikeienuella sp.]
MSDLPELVIFDCDGVLVDSEPIFNRVLYEYLCGCGAALSFVECCTLFTGKSARDVEQYLTDTGLSIPESWPKGFYDQALEALSREVVAMKGALAVLHALGRAEVPFCVASNGLMAKMEVTLARTAILPLVEGNMFSAYEIGQSKPAPDVFLHAAKVNGTAPDRCIVVEDSASGFEAAAAAGMACYAFTPDDSGGPLFGAVPFRRMAELPELLGLSD